MNKKLTILCGFALVLSCSAAFAAEGAKPEKAENKGQEQKKEAKTAAKAKAPKAVLRKIAKEEIGKEAVCPVTGEKFKVTEETISASYKGKVYYFCCPGCDKGFIASPEKYLNKKKAEQAKIYVCPMGDYQGDKPGKCPKCGMNLLEKK
ncbi:MAG: heavy metal-binding domain-containing protein [Elusimicrobiales bacterium]|nr:heavy metal-binding domain-containing protein [Elusimicrobiales bacterium]